MPQSRQHLVLNLNNSGGYQILALIFSSLMTNDLEHVFVWFFSHS